MTYCERCGGELGQACEGTGTADCDLNLELKRDGVSPDHYRNRVPGLGGWLDGEGRKTAPLAAKPPEAPRAPEPARATLRMTPAVGDVRMIVRIQLMYLARRFRLLGSHASHATDRPHTARTSSRQARQPACVRPAATGSDDNSSRTTRRMPSRLTSVSSHASSPRRNTSAIGRPVLRHRASSSLVRYILVLPIPAFYRNTACVPHAHTVTYHTVR